MVRGGCLPLRGCKGMESKYNDDLGVCGTNETKIHVVFWCVNTMTWWGEDG